MAFKQTSLYDQTTAAKFRHMLAQGGTCWQHPEVDPPQRSSFDPRALGRGADRGAVARLRRRGPVM